MSGGNNEYIDSGSQALEAMQSLVDYHEGRWRGVAKSFSVTPDVAAGIVQRRRSPPYEVSVKLGLDPKRRDFTLQETTEWTATADDDESREEGEGEEQRRGATSLSSRTMRFGESNVDVDSVDGSYSYDSTLPDLPPSDITGTDKLARFVVEHCIALSDDVRARCLALYGLDQSLIRVVICEEERMKEPEPQQQQQAVDPSKHQNDGKQSLTAADILEMQSDIDRLVDKITGGGGGNGGGGTATGSTKKDRMEQLQNVMSSSSSSSSSSESPSLSRHPATLLELSSGVWLGDVVIRDRPSVSAASSSDRGFGSATTTASKPSKSSSSSSFADWSIGVQKVAWRWKWNFGDDIRQLNEAGKAMGAELFLLGGGGGGKSSRNRSDPAPQQWSMVGSVCVNEGLSRRIPKEQRMSYLNWDGDDAVGFLAGSYSIQLPRYLRFDGAGGSGSNGSDGQRTLPSFHTDFSAYQSSSSSVSNEFRDEEVGNLPGLKDVVCSKLTRSYNYEGKLKQGCSAFYTLKRFGDESEE